MPVDGYDAALRRLIVEAGFAAVNHGLQREMRAILASLPDWLDDPEVLAACQATLLFGLGDRAGAASRLDNADPVLCAPLRRLLHDTPARPAGTDDLETHQ